MKSIIYRIIIVMCEILSAPVILSVWHIFFGHTDTLWAAVLICLFVVRIVLEAGDEDCLPLTILACILSGILGTATVMYMDYKTFPFIMLYGLLLFFCIFLVITGIAWAAHIIYDKPESDEDNEAYQCDASLAKRVMTINRKTGADIKIEMRDAEKYEILMDDRVYETNLDADKAKHVLDELEEYLACRNRIRVTTLHFGEMTELRNAIQMEMFIVKNAGQYLGLQKTENEIAIVYAPKDCQTHESRDDYDDSGNTADRVLTTFLLGTDTASWKAEWQKVGCIHNFPPLDP